LERNAGLAMTPQRDTLGVAGVLETSPIGERRWPGCDPTERSLGQVAVLLRGFFCRPFSGSLFWRTFFGMLWCRRCCFLADFEHGWRSRDQLHWEETPVWPLLVHLLSLQRALRGAMHSYVGILNSRIVRLLLSSFFGESPLAYFFWHALVPKVPLFGGFRAWLAS